MSLGPLMIDLEGPALRDHEKDLLCHPKVGGVILFSRNYEDRRQLQDLTSAIHTLRKPALLIAVDHEGGRVQRFREGFTELPAVAAFGDIYDRDPPRALSAAEDCGWLMAIELRTAGVDFSFAPVLDLRSKLSRVIDDRAFSADPEIVARLARACIRGMRAGGMAAVGKHFPGHGTVVADSHHELPVDHRSYYEIAAHDLVPFRRLVAAGMEGVMPAHVVYPEVDTLPAGFSATWIGAILRGELGFQGVVFSDDLSMTGAAGVGGYVERAEAAQVAGCDMTLVCNSPAGVHSILAESDIQVQPVTQVRLMRLHGRQPGLNDSNIRQDARWRSTSSMIAAINAAPELDLGDDSPA